MALEARPALDFLISLVHDTEPELLPRDAAWHEGAMASLSDTLRRDFDRAFGHSDEEKGLGWALIPLIVPDTAVQRSADVVAVASRLDVRDLCREACTEDPDLTELRALMERHFAGEPGLEAEMLTAAPPALRGAISRVVKDPDGEMRSLRRILRAWQERFAEIVERVLRMQERDVAQRRPELASMPWSTSSRRRPTDTAGCRRPRAHDPLHAQLLRPSLQLHLRRGAWHLICYPLAESALDGDPGGVPSGDLAALRALGDESGCGSSAISPTATSTDRDRRADGPLQADRQAPSRPAPRRRPGDSQRDGRPHLLQPRRERLDDPGLELARYLGGTPASAASGAAGHRDKHELDEHRTEGREMQTRARTAVRQP